MTTPLPVLALEDVRRGFREGAARLEVLRGATVAVAAGEMVALVGPSGAGKSTLLQVAGLLEQADAGEVRIAGQACAGLAEGERTRVRRERLGFVYQFHHLLPEFSAAENVMLPQMIGGRSRAAAAARASELLQRLGLGARLSHRPAELSGGEQQRVAIARAIANEPLLVLADEPTGNLDQETAQEVFALLRELQRERRFAALVATHNPDLAAAMDRTVRLQAGVLVETTGSND
ncbi:MAG: ABC transporter ATP-binding protein [Alphaproteobacteria bacterium]|nr:ABC transporter ATP-binding protein [Alphaproteobacteria bacterium]